MKISGAIIPRGELERQKQISDAYPNDHRHDYEELNMLFTEIHMSESEEL